MAQSKTFIKITNKDIYDRIVDLEKKLEQSITSTKINAAIIAIIISLLCTIIVHLIS